MCINFCCSVLWSNNPTIHLKNCFHCDTSSEHIFQSGRCKSMPLVALAVTHSIILLVLLRRRKQQMANTALDPDQHLPNETFREAEGTSRRGRRNKSEQVRWVHTSEGTGEIQQDKQNPRVQKTWGENEMSRKPSPGVQEAYPGPTDRRDNQFWNSGATSSKTA